MSQGETLGQAFGEASLRAERRALGNYRVTRMLRDAAAENEIERYQQSRRGALALIARLEGGAPRRARTVTRAASPADCPECRKLAARYDLTPDETAEICRAARQKQPSATAYQAMPYCRGCGALSGSCRCGGGVIVR